MSKRRQKENEKIRISDARKNVSVGTEKDNKGRKFFLLTASFLVPACIFFVLLVSQGFFPNGTKTIIFMDLKGQYMEFLASLRYTFHSEHSLFFSWSRAMGGNALGLYAYYTGGVLSFLSCFFPLSKIWMAVEILEILEVGLCGLTFAVFLEWGLREKPGSFSVIVFSSLYALMSYNMVYSCCFMWLDGCIILPLVILGIEKIFQGKKGLLFYGMLSISMISNYYTAYMICLFSVLYVIYRFVGKISGSAETGKKLIKAQFIYILRYAGMALLSALTALPVLYSVYQDLTTGKLKSSGDWTDAATWYEFPKIFSKFVSGQYDSITSQGGLPSVYCGVIVLLFLLLYFIQRNRKISEKITALLVLGIFLFSFWNVKADKIWHGFQMPNWFPWRYTFLFSFFMIVLAYQAFAAISFSKKNMEYSIIGVVSVISVIDMGYNGIACINGLGNQFGYMEIQEYEDFYNKTVPLVETVKKQDQGLYRMDKDYFFSLNDAMLFGYNGLTHYSSTYNASINTTTPRLGLAQAWFWNSGFGATPLVDSLFGVKYRMAVKNMPSWYEETDKKEDVTLYKNTSALPFCFAASENCLELHELTGDVFGNQNTLLSALLGKNEEYLTPLEYSRNDMEKDTELSFTAKAEEPVYLYMQHAGGSWGDIYVNDQFVNNYFSSETTCAVYLGTFRPGENVSVHIRSEDASFRMAWISSLDVIKLKEDIGNLGKSVIKSEKEAGSLVSETVDVEKGQVIATSIPYEEGYTVRIDGKRVSYESYLDTFIAIRTSPGKHRLQISFTPPGMKLGLCGSLAAIAIVLLYMFGIEKIMSRLKKKTGQNGGE